MTLNMKWITPLGSLAILMPITHALFIQVLPLNNEESDSKFAGFWTYAGEMHDTLQPIPAEASGKFAYRDKEGQQFVKHTAYLVPEGALFGIQIEPFASKPFDIYKTVMFYHARSHSKEQTHNYNTPVEIHTRGTTPELHPDYSYDYSSQPDKDQYYWVHTEKEGKVSFIHDGKNNIQISDNKNPSEATKIDGFHHIIHKYCKVYLSAHSVGLKALCTNTLRNKCNITPDQLQKILPDLTDYYIKSIEDYSLERFNTRYKHLMDEDGRQGEVLAKNLCWVDRIFQVIGTVQVDHAIIGLARDDDHSLKCIYIKLDSPLSELLEFIKEDSTPQLADNLEDEESTQRY